MESISEQPNEAAKRSTQDILDVYWPMLPTMGTSEVTNWLDLLNTLSPDEKRRYLRGKQSQLKQVLWQSDGSYGRSSAYEWARAVKVAICLHEAGLIDMNAGCRDRESGRRVKTIIRELGRIDWQWDAPGQAKLVCDAYRQCRDAQLDLVKSRVKLSKV